MSKIDSASLDVIEDYYDAKIKEVTDEQYKYREEFANKLRSTFENDDGVQIVQIIFKDLEERFNSDILSLRCDIHASSSRDYKDMMGYKRLEDKIREYKKEKALLITQLECNAKNSKEYKKAYERLQELFK